MVEVFCCLMVLRLSGCGAVRVAMGDGHYGAIPDISVCTSSELVMAARKCNVTRKMVLRQYRIEHLRPLLSACDQREFLKALDNYWPCFGISIASFFALDSRADSCLLAMDPEGVRLSWYRIWSLVRISGRWPLPVLVRAPVEATVDRCAACGEAAVTVLHALVHCPHTMRLYRLLSTQCVVPVRSHVSAFLATLFGDGAPVEQRVCHISYVAHSVTACAGSFLGGAVVEGLAEMVDQLLDCARAAAAAPGVSST